MRALPSAGSVWALFEVDPYWPQGEDEPMGTKDKQWLTLDDGSRWLFKYARESQGVTRNEDWAEWASWRVAVSLRVPAAEVVPATHEGRRGVLSKSIVPAPAARLEHGNELLQKKLPGYLAAESRHNPEYTVDAVRTALDGVAPPFGFGELSLFTAFDVWASFLVLDAIIAGRDRHHENWAIVDDAGVRWLAPSYDHGNSLGFQESEERVCSLLSDGERLTTWLNRGTSHHFVGRPQLVSLACQALSLCSATARDYWVDSLHNVAFASLRDSLDTVPKTAMSDVRRRFVLSLLEANWRRLIDELAS